MKSAQASKQIYLCCITDCQEAAATKAFVVYVCLLQKKMKGLESISKTWVSFLACSLHFYPFSVPKQSYAFFDRDQVYILMCLQKTCFLMVKVKSKLPKEHTKNSSFEGTEFARQGLHISEI